MRVFRSSSVSNGYCGDYSCCFARILSVINVILIRLKIILKSVRRFTSPINTTKLDDFRPVSDISLFTRGYYAKSIRFLGVIRPPNRPSFVKNHLSYLFLFLYFFFITRCRCIHKQIV